MVDDEKLRLLAFEDRWHFMAILCLKGQGVLDANDPLMMRKAAVKMGLDVRSLEEVARRLAEVGLIDSNTLQPLQWDARQMRSDSDSTATERKRRQREKAKQDAASEPVTDEVTDESRVTGTNVTRTDTDIDTEEDKKEANASLSAAALPTCPHAEILALYAKRLPTLPQPKAELWDGQRAKSLTARWRWCLTALKANKTRYATDKASALDFFDRYFDYVSRSDFLTGRDGRWANCDLAWLVKAENFAKVMQGNYDNREAA